MVEVVYALCALTCVVCAVLLMRGWSHGRSRLLLWSSLCFVGLALNNVVLFIDKVLLPEQDLSLWRNGLALVSLLVLLFGLIWESR